MAQKSAKLDFSEDSQFSRYALGHISDAVFWAQQTGELVYVNLAACRLLGYTEAELLALSVTDIADDYTLPRWEKHWEQIKQMGSANFESWNKHKNGDVFRVEIHLNYLNFNGMEVICGIAHEISERKRVETDLVNNEEKYRMLAENILDVIWIYNLDFRKFTYVSPSVYKLRGYTVEEILQEDIEDGLAPASVEQIDKELPLAVQFFIENPTLEKFYYNEFQQRCKNGSFIWIETVTKIQRNKNGEMEVLGVTRDIDQRKKAEEALRKSEEKFAKAFNNIPDVVILTTIPDGKIVEVNDTVVRMSGYTKTEVLGKTTLELNFWQDTSERQKYLGLMSENGRALNFETGIRKKSGEIFIAQVSGETIELSGAQFVLSVIHDITDRKNYENALVESEKKYQVLYTDSPDAYLISDYHVFIDCNKAAEEMLRGDRSQIIGKNVLELSPEFQPNGIRSADLVLEIISRIKKQDKCTFEWVHQRLDGTDFFAELSVTSIIFNGKPALFNSWRDITDRKNSESELKQNERRLHELNATKDRFFSIIAHDLKSPFNSIMGFSNLLVEQVREKDYDGIENYAEIIQRSSNRAMNLLKNLLDWARVQTGKIEFNPEYVELVQLIYEVVGLLSDAALQKSIKISFNLPHNSPVYADSSMISTILRNLISNAIKFTEKTGAVTISLVNHPGHIEVSVRDTGVGMTKAMIDKLFKIDEGISTPDTNNERGTGLGLILCQEFIKQHLGSIWVKSEKGKGSVFSFSLPKR